MKKLQLLIAAAALICVVSFTLSSAVISNMAGRLDSQNAVSRWVSDDACYAQVSAFLTEEAGITRMSVERILASNIDSAITDASLEASMEAARLYTLACSAETVGSLELTDKYGKTVKSGVSVTITAAGGDYFIFHPLTFLSGYYFSTTDILNDCVIIDNDIAWQFFGSYDVVGRALKLNGRNVYISGITESGVLGDYSEFYGERPRIFVSYSLAEELFGNLPVTTVEVLLPDPIDGFALEMFKSALATPESETVYVENSARFSDESLALRLKGFADCGISTGRVVYPYYENTAIKLSNAAAVLYIFKIVPIYVFAFLILTELVIIYIKRRAISAIVKRFVSERLSRMRREREFRKQLKNINQGEPQ